VDTSSPNVAKKKQSGNSVTKKFTQPSIPYGLCTLLSILIANQRRARNAFFLLPEGTKRANFIKIWLIFIFFNGNCIGLMGFCLKPLPASTTIADCRLVDVSFSG